MVEPVVRFCSIARNNPTYTVSDGISDTRNSKRAVEMNRTETTAMLSALVERRLDSRTSYWAKEVSFDKGTPMWRRIDYVGFKPYTPNYAVEPVSVELGVFSCYEVKSCLEDFESGNGLTFYGDENYLVTTRELAEQLQDMRRLPRNIDQVLVPTTKGDMLRKLYDLSGNGSPSYRHRPASEMLYAMVEANGRRASRYRK